MALKRKIKKQNQKLIFEKITKMKIQCINFSALGIISLNNFDSFL